MTGFLFCIFLVLFSVHGNDDDNVFYEGRYTWFENIDENETENDQSDITLYNAAHQLLELCKKAGNTTTVHFLEESEGNVHDGNVDQDKVPLLKSSRPERVDFTDAFNYCLKTLDLDTTSLENAFIWCLKVSMWQYMYYYKLQNQLESNTTKENEIYELLQESDLPGREKRNSKFLRKRKIAPRNMKRPGTGFRQRQEYRTLSVIQRKNFHDALNKLYMDGTVTVFTNIYRSAQRKGVGRSVAYLMWMRAFVALFEEALRKVDDTVSIPYWDSSIDNNMVTPALSVIWDDKHLGTSNGIVNNGMLAGWFVAKQPLRRGVGRDNRNRLISQARIDDMMKFCRFGDFSRRLTSASNGVHRWIGGTMNRENAASDPIFYMHYAFIDYLLAKFQLHQKNDCKVNPELDYPPTNNARFSPKAKMLGMKFLRNKDGIASYWTKNWYTYQQSPSCATKCDNSPDIFCDHENNLCVGISSPKN